MRARVAALAAVLLVSGCGDGPPPDVPTSQALIEKTILDSHRFQATGNGEAACRLLTKRARAATIAQDRRTAAAVGTVPAGSCAQVIGRYAGFAPLFREVLLNTRVDAVRVAGERATVTVHSSAVQSGVTRQIPPADLHLRWEHGRWLIG